MNLRHAAALALVGWYLMVPPMVNGTTAIDRAAPLSKWATYGSYDTASQCFSARVEQITIAGQIAGKGQNPDAQGLAMQLLKSQCIAADDPRLKEK